MLVAGIDVGSQTTKVVLVRDGTVVGMSVVKISEDVEVGIRRAIDQALDGTGFSFSDLITIVATGSGRKLVTLNCKQKTLLTCLAKGAIFLNPSVRTVLDVGAESSTFLRITEKGKVDDYQGHDRCASGTGLFLDTMAQKVIGMPIEEMAKASLEGKNRAEITNMCAVFAEQEVISHIHRVPPTPRNDVIKGIHGSMATRIAGMAKRTGIKPEVMLCGGVARNVGFVHELELELKLKTFIPEHPQAVAALGAALSAGEEK